MQEIAEQARKLEKIAESIRKASDLSEQLFKLEEMAEPMRKANEIAEQARQLEEMVEPIRQSDEVERVCEVDNMLEATVGAWKTKTLAKTERQDAARHDANNVSGQLNKLTEIAEPIRTVEKMVEPVLTAKEMAERVHNIDSVLEATAGAWGKKTRGEINQEIAARREAEWGA